MADAAVNGPSGRSPAGDVAYWREQVAAWKNSGVSQSRFCKQRGLSRFVFGRWKIQVEGRSPRGGARLVRLRAGKLPISLGGGGIQLWIQGRYRVEVAEGFEAQTLSRLLQVLEGR